MDGWLIRREGLTLARLAARRRVLEIGSYCGKSTICMAQTADIVVAVDPHDGRGTPRPKRTLTEFRRNIAGYRVGKRVHLANTTAKHFCVIWDGPPFGMVFIDGAHDYASVADDWRIACSLSTYDAILAFHDYGAERDVTRLVDEIVKIGVATWLGRSGSVAVLRKC